MFKNLFLWVFPPKPERKPMSANGRLIFSIRTTALSRYRAFNRVKLQDKVAFLTNIIVSLGLVFIPMMQNAKINLAFPDSVLNMMQLFLGVVVLVYSTIVGTARYPQRADEFEKNANEINGLSAKLMRCVEDMEKKDKELGKLRECSPLTTEQIELLIKNITELEEKIERIGNEHSKVASSIGTHETVDYDNALLEMSDTKYRGGRKIGMWAWTKLRSFVFFFSLPSTLLIFELIFISDMLRVTAIFTPYLTVPAGR